MRGRMTTALVGAGCSSCAVGEVIVDKPLGHDVTKVVDCDTLHGMVARNVELRELLDIRGKDALQGAMESKTIVAGAIAPRGPDHASWMGCGCQPW